VPALLREIGTKSARDIRPIDTERIAKAGTSGTPDIPL